MKKDCKIFLAHIIESCRAIEKYTEGLSKENFQQNEEKQDAVIRRIEIIGEAVKNLPLDFRKQYPGTNWRGKAGMRDVLIHDYFGVDLNLVWGTIQELTAFKEGVVKILDELGGQEMIDLLCQ